MSRVKTLSSLFGGSGSDPVLGEIHEAVIVVATFEKVGNVGSDLEAWIRDLNTVQTVVSEVNNLSSHSRRVIRVEVFYALGLLIIPPKSYVALIDAFSYMDEAVRNHWFGIPLDLRKNAVSMVSSFLCTDVEKVVKSESRLKLNASLFAIRLSLKVASKLTKRDIKVELGKATRSLIDAVLQASVNDPEFNVSSPETPITITLKDGSDKVIKLSDYEQYAGQMMKFTDEKMPPRRGVRS